MDTIREGDVVVLADVKVVHRRGASIRKMLTHKRSEINAPRQHFCKWFEADE